MSTADKKIIVVDVNLPYQKSSYCMLEIEIQKWVYYEKRMPMIDFSVCYYFFNLTNTLILVF